MDDVLPLARDGDEGDLFRSIGDAFGVKLRDEDLAGCHTVGDLHRLLLTAVPHVERSEAGAAPKAFFKLKEGIEKYRPGTAVLPGTKIYKVIPYFGAAPLMRRLARETGLKMPALSIGPVGALIQAASIGLPFAGAFLRGWAGILASLPFAAVGFWLSFRVARMPRRIATVGDLARAVAGLNVLALGATSEALRHHEVWIVMEANIRDSLNWDGPVRPSTRFLPAKT